MDQLIPFDKDSNLIPVPSLVSEDQIYWHENTEFKDKLEVVNYNEVKKWFTLRSRVTKKEYVIFISEMYDVLRNSVIVDGYIEIHGKWTFIRKGKYSFGLKAV